MPKTSSIFVAIGFVVAGAGGAQAQGPDIGEALYNQYCATCHGSSGAGDGPLTEIMMEQPGDLTQLAANNDGEFPMLQVIHIIDGRTGVRAHGGPMPTYGAIFSTEAADQMGYGSVVEVRGRILSLAMYLESLQK